MSGHLSSALLTMKRNLCVCSLCKCWSLVYASRIPFCTKGCGWHVGRRESFVRWHYSGLAANRSTRGILFQHVSPGSTFFALIILPRVSCATASWSVSGRILRADFFISAPIHIVRTVSTQTGLLCNAHRDAHELLSSRLSSCNRNVGRYSTVQASF